MEWRLHGYRQLRGDHGRSEERDGDVRPGSDGHPDSDVDEQIAWTERAGTIRTSTTVDRERGREMEIDALIGVVVRRGRQYGVPTPCSDVMLALLRAIDRNWTNTNSEFTNQNSQTFVTCKL